LLYPHSYSGYSGEEMVINKVRRLLKEAVMEYFKEALKKTERPYIVQYTGCPKSPKPIVNVIMFVLFIFRLEMVSNNK
jgi:hypothetical protein